MNDRWYYADKGRAVGPFSLRDLCDVLQRIPNWREVLVWREEVGDWVPAGNISELHHVGATPPPIPQATGVDSISVQDLQTTSRGAEEVSRKTIFFVIGLFLLAHLILVLVLNNNSNINTDKSQNTANYIAYTFGKFIAFVTMSGLVPVVVWAFWRFQANKARGIFYAWLLLFVIFSVLSVFGQSRQSKLEKKTTQHSGNELNKEEIVENIRRLCVKTQRQYELSYQFGLTEAQIISFCDCYGNGIVNQFKLEEAKYYLKSGKISAALQEKIDDLGIVCAQRILGK